MLEKFTKPYDPAATESRLYEAWEESGLFNPDECVRQGVAKANAETFSMVLPPPNVTGILHLGHAYEDALQDSVVRYQRMRGRRVLWLPGTDSAAIATQARVEREIEKKEGKNRHELGREELVRRVAEFAKASEGTILSQTRRMGASLDWSRYAYALDEKRSHAVVEAFKRMYEAGLIYRGHRIVNWDPRGQTTISDDEVVYREEPATLYYLKYGPFTISTARPETKFGDKYVVVHPEDERYAQFQNGQKIELEWINGPITATIIRDAVVDREFGTGAMTITPWHDATDFDIAQRYDLDKEQIIDEYGKLLPITGEFAGMKIKDARDKIVEKLREKGLLVKEEPYTHNVATAERTGGVIEPQIKLQWFIDVNKPFPLLHSEIPGIEGGSEITLKALMRAAVEHGGISMPPDGFRTAYFHWIDNLRDWCISRQIWFGHRIPVWYGGEQIHIGTEPPATEGWQQDPDVLDTWFSSQLWTFSTLGWPEETADLATYHPTAVILPGYEILNLWVSRMILASGFLLGQVPFKTVMLHGVVRDGKGRKFSKSLGNGIDPIEMIEKYGADALRMGLLVGSAIGHDIRFDEQKVKGYKHFANKLWNIARFVLENAGDANMDAELTEDDKVWDADQKNRLADVTKDMEEYRIYLAAEKLYHYIWHNFADYYIEYSKEGLRGDDAFIKESRKRTLVVSLDRMLRALHPFMPFITEEIWQSMPTKDADFLMIAKWPTS